MKKLLVLFTALLPLFGFANQTISVAATPVPHAEILEFIKPKLAAQNIELKIHVFNDYVQPNLQVSQGKIDVNYMQTKPYFNEINSDRNLKLISVADIHIEPFGMYSRKISNLADLKEGSQIAIPSEPSNTGRALLLLQQAKLIELKPEAGILATVKDITLNPKKIKIRELEAASLPRVLGQVELALINTNYALEAGLNPSKDALLIENTSSPYLNIVATQESKKDDQLIKILVKELQTEEVKQFILDRYQGAVVPAF